MGAAAGDLRAAHRVSWPWFGLGIAAFLTGVFLRWYQLRPQVLIDDEWHAIRKLVGSDALGIATHFGFADYCIPLTLYYRWLYNLGALDEWRMRMPLLLAGIALLVVAPLLLRRLVAWPTRMLWVGLLAISPVLVYLSRTARPYALVAVLGFVAVVAFHEWQRRDRAGFAWAAIYVVTTFFAGWLHLLSLVFTLWPFAYYGMCVTRDALRTPTRARGTRALARLFVLALACALPLALVLAPPLINDWRSMVAKAGTHEVTLHSLYRGVLMQLGIADPWVCMLLLALLLVGVWRLARRDRDFTALIVSMTVVGTAVIALARPAWIGHQAVLVRYTVIALPFLLLFVAEGFVAVVERLRMPALGAVFAAAIALVALYTAGPIPGYLYAPNQFMGAALFQFDYDPRENPYSQKLQLGPVPPFYLDLAKRPASSVTLIETPYMFNSNFTPDPWYQAIHRQKLKFALASPLCGLGEWDEYPYTATGVRFRNVAQLADVLNGATYGADYLVLRMHPWTLPAGTPRPWPDMVACVAKVTDKLGAPTYRDDQIVVFALSGKSSSSTSR